MTESPEAHAPRVSTDGERTRELERRIREIESRPDGQYGDFTRLDWWICTLGAVVVPALLVWWFQP